MRLELPDIMGLTIGFTLGGLGLAVVLLMQDDPPPPAAEPPPPPVVITPRTPPTPQATSPSPRTAPLPAIIHPAQPIADPRRIATLPNVIHPSAPVRGIQPRPDGNPPPGNVSGTGFFIGQDGTILTAAHVVDGCARAEVLSRHLARTTAQVLATDARHDLALIRARVRPPAVLSLTERSSGSGDLIVYGYPAQGDALIPSETRGRARPDLRRLSGWTDNPGLWIEAGGVRPGYSGGPVVTEDGEAVGLIKGVVLRPDPTDRRPSGIAIGPDTKAIGAFLRREAPEQEDWKQQTGGNDAARKAVVHVLCWR